jgi:hypothetical protein
MKIMKKCSYQATDFFPAQVVRKNIYIIFAATHTKLLFLVSDPSTISVDK